MNPGILWNKHSRWILWVSIAALAFASSATSIFNGFTYDDIHIVQNNDRVHTLSEPWAAFTQTYWSGGTVGTLYRPLTILGFATQWAIGDGDPWVFHATNILLYVVVCIAFYWLMRILLSVQQGSGHSWAPWAAAALFAVHPVHVEAVGNVVGQSELTCALMLMLGVGLYIKWRREEGISLRRALLLMLIYAGACLFKEHGILLLPLLIISELAIVRIGIPLRERLRQLRPFYLALIVVVLTFIWVRSLVLGEMQGDFPHAAWFGVSWSARFWTMCIVALEWFRLFFWPASLSPDYSPGRITIRYGPTPEMLATLLLMAAVIALAVISRKRTPIVTYGVLWIVITLSLISNLLFPSGIILAERTLFLPSAGAMMMLVGLAQLVTQQVYVQARPGARVFIGVLLTIALVLGAVRSAKRQSVWKSNMTMFTAMFDDAPESYRGQWAYYGALSKSGHEDAALRILESAYKTFPNDAGMTGELGYRYRLRGDCDRAIPLLRHALKIRPSNSIVRGRLATCYMMQNKYDEAWREAVKGMETPEEPENAILLVRTVLARRKEALKSP